MRRPPPRTLAFFGLIGLVIPPSTRADPPRRFERPMPARVVEVKLSERRVACLLPKGEVVVLDRNDGRDVAVLAGDGLPATALALGDDGERVAVAGVREVVGMGLPRPGGERPPLTLGDVPAPAPAAPFGPSTTTPALWEVTRRALAIGTHHAPWSSSHGERPPVKLGGTVRLRRVRDGGDIRRRDDLTAGIVGLSLDGPLLTVVGGDLDFVVLDEALRTTAASPAWGPVANDLPQPAVAFGAGGMAFACIVTRPGFRMDLALCDPTSRRLEAVRRDDQHPAPWAVALSRDGRAMAACGPGGIHAWDVAKGGPARALTSDRPDPATTTFVAFGATADRLITGDDAGLIRVWDLATGRVAWSGPGPKRDLRAADLRDGRLTLVSGAYHYPGPTIEPLVIQAFDID